MGSATKSFQFTVIPSGIRAVSVGDKARKTLTIGSGTYTLVTPPDAFTTTPSGAATSLGFFTFGVMNGITDLVFTTAHSIPGFDLELDGELVTVSFPNLIDVDPSNTQGGFITITGGFNLTTISMPLFVPTNSITYSFNGNHLNQATVDAILHRFALATSYVSGTLDLSGGSNATPSGTGLTDKGIIQGRGATVLTN